jgi:predicted enzyme related to lactoylglutathione lyase
MANPVAWFEIHGKDGRKLSDFYSKLFGWKVDSNNPMNYGMIDTGAGQGAIGGGINGGENEAWVTFYVSVPDLNAAVAEVTKLGGTVVQPPDQVPGGPMIALITDPEGNRIGLMKPMM